MKRFLFLLTFLYSLTSFGQIQIGGEEKEPDKKAKKEKVKEKEEKEEKPVDGTTEIFFGANWSATNRVLKINDNVFGDSLGERANETGLNAWSFSLGMRNRINRFLMWEGGISFVQNGEQYSFETVDSSYAYTSNYRFIAMPLKLYYTYGEKNLRLMAGVGLAPQMAMAFRQEINFRDTEGDEGSESVKTKVGQSSFAVSFVGNIGINYSFNSGWGVYILPEYRYQLSSTYLKTEPYKHFGTAFGVSFGLTKKL